MLVSRLQIKVIQSIKVKTIKAHNSGSFSMIGNVGSADDLKT